MKDIAYLNYISSLIFSITTFILCYQLYLVNELQFRIFLIELGYGLILFIAIFLISWFLRKTRYQFDLVMILSGICAYGAYLADLMTKSTPNWGHLRANIPFIIGFIIIGLLNIVSLLHITTSIVKKRILNPLHQAIKQKNEIEKTLRQQRSELSKFAHMMAHDLRNNLTSIMGYAELISKESDKEYSYIILEKTKQIQNLLKTSLKLADSGRIIDKREIVDLTDLTMEIIDIVVPNLIKVKINGLPKIFADKPRLFQVWKNLLENAVIHGNPNEIRIYSKLKNSTLSIFIENDGKPISKGFIREFQDPNFSIDFNKKGLGLKIVKRIIKAHDWKITIKDEPCTTFIIKIPNNGLSL